MSLSNPSIQSKLPNVKTTIFTTVNILAKKYNAINLSQGYPDYEMDLELIELVNKAMKGVNNQYAPMQGAYVLRESISKKIESQI